MLRWWLRVCVLGWQGCVWLQGVCGREEHAPMHRPTPLCLTDACETLCARGLRVHIRMCVV